MHDKVWMGASVLLAPAPVFFGNHGMLPPNRRTIIIHAPSDQVVPYAHSLGLMASGGEGLELWNASTDYRRDPTLMHTGNHRLHDITTNGMLLRACSRLLSEIPKEAQ